LNKIWRRISKLGAATGTLFGLVGTVASIFDKTDENRHQELVKGFSKVHDGIDDVKQKLGNIGNLIKDEHAKTRVFGYLNEIKGAANKLKQYDKYPEAYEDEIIRYWEDNSIYHALKGVYNVVNDPSDSMVKTQYERLRGNWQSLFRLRLYIAGVIFEGTSVYATSCQVYETKRKGKSAQEAKRICHDIKGDDFKEDDDDLAIIFQKYLNNAREYYKTNMIKDISNTEFSSNTPNTNLTERIKNEFDKKYDWVDSAVAFYNPVRGRENHAVSAQLSKFEDRGKNWFVMTAERQNSKFYLTRSLAKIVSDAKLKEVVDICPPAIPGYSHFVEPCHHYFGNAREYFESIKRALSQKRISWIGMAVIKHGNAAGVEWTNSNRFVSLNNSPFSVIIGVDGTLAGNIFRMIECFSK
jgi:hypothetical protein